MPQVGGGGISYTPVPPARKGGNARSAPVPEAPDVSFQDSRGLMDALKATFDAATQGDLGGAWSEFTAPMDGFWGQEAGFAEHMGTSGLGLTDMAQQADQLMSGTVSPGEMVGEYAQTWDPQYMLTHPLEALANIAMLVGPAHGLGAVEDVGLGMAATAADHIPTMRGLLADETGSFGGKPAPLGNDPMFGSETPPDFTPHSYSDPNVTYPIPRDRPKLSSTKPVEPVHEAVPEKYSDYVDEFAKGDVAERPAQEPTVDEGMQADVEGYMRREKLLKQLFMPEEFPAPRTESVLDQTRPMEDVTQPVYEGTLDNPRNEYLSPNPHPPLEPGEELQTHLQDLLNEQAGLKADRSGVDFSDTGVPIEEPLNFEPIQRQVKFRDDITGETRSKFINTSGPREGSAGAGTPSRPSTAGNPKGLQMGGLNEDVFGKGAPEEAVFARVEELDRQANLFEAAGKPDLAEQARAERDAVVQDFALRDTPEDRVGEQAEWTYEDEPTDVMVPAPDDWMFKLSREGRGFGDGEDYLNIEGLRKGTAVDAGGAQRVEADALSPDWAEPISKPQDFRDRAPYLLGPDQQKAFAEPTFDLSTPKGQKGLMRLLREKGVTKDVPDGLSPEEMQAGTYTPPDRPFEGEPPLPRKPRSDGDVASRQQWVNDALDQGDGSEPFYGPTFDKETGKVTDPGGPRDVQAEQASRGGLSDTEEAAAQDSFVGLLAELEKKGEGVLPEEAAKIAKDSAKPKKSLLDLHREKHPDTIVDQIGRGMADPKAYAEARGRVARGEVTEAELAKEYADQVQREATPKADTSRWDTDARAKAPRITGNPPADTKAITVVGSREGVSEQAVKSYVKSLPTDGSVTIVSGGAPGVDRWAAEAAKEAGIPVVEYDADWTTHGRSAGYKRNPVLVEKADEVVAFHANDSKGTANTIALAKKAGKKTQVFDGSYYGESPKTEVTASPKAERTYKVDDTTVVLGGQRPEGSVYVGRAGKGEQGTFGNPYKVERGADTTEAVEKYETYLRKKIEDDPAFAKKVEDLYGKTLWYPTEVRRPSHADVLAKLAKELHDE